MTVRTASCRCGQLRAKVTAEPVRISVCHCLDCQKRTGSAFAAQVRFPVGTVSIEGKSIAYAHPGGGGNIARFHFCPTCSDTLFYTNDNAGETVAIPLGAFDDPYSLAPRVSVWEERKHPWVEIIGEDVEHQH